jgi:hypothetical protein
MSKQVKPQTNEQKGKAYRKFSYILAWINFIAVVGLAVFSALKDHQPPERSDYDG